MLNTNNDNSDRFNVEKCHLVCEFTIVSELAGQTLCFHCFKKES